MMPRYAHAYIPLDADPFIFATTAVNDAGIRYEPGPTTVVPLSASAAEIGSAAIETLAQHSRTDRNLRDLKKTEWPAYLASGLKAVKHFERGFAFVAIEENQLGIKMTRFENNGAMEDNVNVPSPPYGEAVGSALLRLRARLCERV